MQIQRHAMAKKKHSSKAAKPKHTLFYFINFASHSNGSPPGPKITSVLGQYYWFEEHLLLLKEICVVQGLSIDRAVIF